MSCRRPANTRLSEEETFKPERGWPKERDLWKLQRKIIPRRGRSWPKGDQEGTLKRLRKRKGVRRGDRQGRWKEVILDHAELRGSLWGLLLSKNTVGSQWRIPCREMMWIDNNYKKNLFSQCRRLEKQCQVWEQEERQEGLFRREVPWLHPGWAVGDGRVARVTELESKGSADRWNRGTARVREKKKQIWIPGPGLK